MRGPEMGKRGRRVTQRRGLIPEPTPPPATMARHGGSQIFNMKNGPRRLPDGSPLDQRNVRIILIGLSDYPVG